MDLTPTEALKAELWRRFGTKEHPSEWDGHYYGGGKLSQRYWEYSKSIEMLNLDRDSVVFDIGGGSPVTGAGFFAKLVATVARSVTILDPTIPDDAPTYSNIEYIRKFGDFATLRQILAERTEITHLVSVSVLEHVAEADRLGMFKAIDESFGGNVFVTTFEYHTVRSYFEQQLTAKTTAELFGTLTRFYPTQFEASPVLCEAAYDNEHLVRLNLKSPFAKRNFKKAVIPQWYPVALKFVAMQPSSI
jgi:hypothetical protein